ncbi:MAG: hypothetical protein LBL66_05975 [Clostridiales bacterium]|nr:hypothetical protein [Clostridiales bacterium]
MNEKALGSGGGIQRVLDEAAERMGNPIAMFDIAYNLWAYTANAATDDPLWNELVRDGKFSHQTVDFFMSENFVEVYARSSGLAVLKSPKLKYDRVNGSIYDKNGLQVANICMVACQKPLADGDLALMRQTCDALAAELASGGYPDTAPRVWGDTLIGDLLEGKTPDESLYRNAIRELRAGSSNLFYVAAADIIQYDGTLTHLAYFCDFLKSIRKDYRYFVYLNNIVILIGAPRPVYNMDKELAPLGEFLKRSNLYVGVSGAFQNPLDLKTHFKQALNALNYGMSLECGRHIFSYDTFKMELFIHAHIDKEMTADLCHPLVFAIRDHDKAHGTEYLEILYSYFLCYFDRRRAADRLQKPPREFSAALRQIRKLFAIDWADYNLPLALFRSIRLLKFFADEFPER